LKITIKTKESKKDIDVSVVSEKYIQPELIELYQNSIDIANIIMQRSKVISAGCREVGMYRCLIHVINYQYRVELKIKDFLFKEFDSIIDNNNGWTSIDVFNVFKFLSALQKRLNNYALGYEVFTNASYKGTTKILIKMLLDSNIPLTIRMPSLVESGNHFINAVGYIETSDKLYIKMKETYTGYNGYDNCFVEWNYPTGYEYFK
jgi:hypothetical protein